MTEEQVSIHERDELLGLIPAAVAVLRGPDHVFSFANDLYRGIVNRELIGRPFREAVPELANQGIFELLDAVYETCEPFRTREFGADVDVHGTGDLVRIYMDYALLPVVEDGRSVGILIHAVDVTELVEAREAATTLADTLEGASLLLSDQNRVLELVASGAPLTDALAALVEMIESRLPGRRASVLLVDDDGTRLRHGSAPSLPGAYNDAIDGIEIGEGVGSCGTAAHRAERVVVSNIEDDPLWEDFRELALQHGLRACWSTPIMSAGGAVVGTFAVYDDEARLPEPADLELVDILARTAAIAIARAQLEKERERSVRVVDTLNRVGRAASASFDVQGIVQAVTDEATQVTGAEFGAFFYNVIDDDGESYMLYTLSGAPREAFEQFPMPRNSAIFEPTFRGEGVTRLDDVRADPRYGKSPPYYGMPEGHLPVTSYLAAPVLDPHGEVLGGLFFGHSEARRFTAEHEELVIGIASQAAIAIVNSRLYEAEQRAREQAEQRARAAFSLEHIDNGVVLTNGAGTVEVWNRAAAAIVGVSGDDAAGRRLEEIVPGWEATTAQLRAGATGSQTVTVDLNGREAWLDVSATRFAGGIVFAFKDVTAERRLEAMRNDLIATVSHELRTPVTAVYGAAKTLERSDVRGDPDLTSKLFEIVKSESTRLMQLVEEILLASNLDSGTVAIQATGVDTLEVAQEAAAVFATSGAEVGVEGTQELARADRHRLLQVVDNLIDNGLKYGGAPVEVAVRRQGERVRIQVADHGPGVPPGARTRIFEKFVRLDPEMRTGVNGTGLGLYIARELVERMGGRLWVEPRRDGGSGAVFVVSLPSA